MIFEGKISQKNQKYSIEVSDLGICVEGESLESGLKAAKETLEQSVNDKEFRVDIVLIDEHNFALNPSDIRPVIALYLKELRAKSGLSLSEVQKRLGLSSENTFAQYEQGKFLPSIHKLSTFIKALAPDTVIVFSTRKVS